MHIQLVKYHALGNDYLVLDARDGFTQPTPEQVRLVCHRNFGAGSDGILLGPLPSNQCPFALRIFNPDGSEAEKSGNGLRIFSRYLFDCGLVKDGVFTIETKGGIVESIVMDNGALVKVAMGRVSFVSENIPVTGPRREVLMEKLTVGDREFVYCAATIGNPHCVLPVEEARMEDAMRYGPLIEKHALFPRRTNVQFLKVLDRRNLRIEIWERGAGYTLASGSSSSACAAVARRMGWCDNNVTVHMPGGQLSIQVSDNFDIQMSGPVTRVWEGRIGEEAFTTRLN